MEKIKNTIVKPPLKIIKVENIGGRYPLGSAYRQADPVDLSEYGYVEKEYVISGLANVYLWPKEEDRPLIRVKDAPYTSRFLIRKPSSADRFSGVVALENFNNSKTIDFAPCAWGLCWEHILESGDAWVGYDVQHAGFRTLKEYDPERYAGIDFGFPNPVPPEERGPLGWHVLREELPKHGMTYTLELPDDFEKGLMFDMSFQIAALMKRCMPGDPLHGYKIKKVCGAAVADFNLYIAGFHPYMTIDGENPVFDGYLKYMSGSGGEISREADMWWHDDERSMRYCSVPVIKIETAGDMRNVLPHPSWACLRRMQDGDEPGRQMRWYELAGVALRFCFRNDWLPYACKEDYEKLGARQTARDDFEFENQTARHIIAGAYRNLKDWMLKGIAPPRAPVIEMAGEYPDVDFVLDEFGNHIGGVRSPYVDVPIASFSDDGSVVMFSREKRNELYGSKENYVRKVAQAAQRMVKERWILPAGAVSIIEQAENIAW